MLEAVEAVALSQAIQEEAAQKTAATYKITGMNMEIRTADGAKVASFQRAQGP